MNQCVPSWDIEDPPIAGNKPSHNGSPQSSTSVKPRISMPEHEVAELTWENGHLAEHGLVKPTPSYPASVVAGTLECIVDQAKLLNSQLPVAIDALVPTQQRRQREGIASGIGSCNNVGNSNEKTKKARLVDNNTVTTVGSRDDTACDTDDFGFTTTYSVSPVLDSNGGGGSPDTANASFNGGGSSRQLTIVEDDSFWHSRRSQSQMEMCGDEDEKVTEGGTVRSTISTKRSRAAAIHNQSERKRRDKINQKMRTLQKLVPNSSKTDKASMLDEVIDYLKQLQAQVTMMSRMGTLGGMPSMMMPMGMQQFQMAMMAQMAQMAQMTQMAQMGIGMRGPPQMAQMGLGMMDMSALSRAGPPTGTSPVLPASPFMPMNCASAWDPSVDRMQQTAGAVTPDPFSAFVACPPQQHMTMDAHQRMAAMYQQQMFQQNQPTNLKK